MFTGPWADLPLEELARKCGQFGYDGLELACWGDHFDIEQALAEPDYCSQRRKLIERHGLDVSVLRRASRRPGGARRRRRPAPGHPAADRLGRWRPGWRQPACRRGDAEHRSGGEKLGVGVVNGFTGSSIWPLVYPFPPAPPEMIEAGFKLLAERWNPILDVFGECGVKFALEVHPAEIAFDLLTARRALAALDTREEFGFTLNPAQLIWQGVDPVEFVRAFPDRIFHVHLTDAVVTLDGRSGILASHLEFRRSTPRLGFSRAGPRQRQFRGAAAGLERHRL